MPQPVRRFAASPTMSTSAKTRIVGAPVPRKEGVDKLLGRARYVDDIEREGMWYGATVRSTIPRGLIRSIGFDRRIDWSEFTVVTAADIPGENHIQLIVADQPCLADGKVNHCEEAILLLAHPDKHKLREAVGAVHIEYEPLPPVFTIEESERQDPIVWGADNLLKSFLLEKGDVDSAVGRAPRTLSKASTAPARRNISTSRTTASSRSTARRAASRCGARCNAPTTCSKSLRAVFDLPEEKVRVIQTETGGAFGGKEDYPSIARLPRGSAGHEERPSGEDGLRPHGGSGRDHQAPSLARAPSHRARQRRQAAGDGDRSRHRRRRVRHALLHGAFARHAALAGPVSVPQCARALALLGDQHRSLRRVSRLRRAASHLRHGAAHGRNRRGARHRSS